MKRALGACAVAMLAVFLFTGLAGAQAKTVTLNTCWMPEHETYIAWKAHKEGWDKAEGIELKLLYFESGMAQMEALPAKQWVVGATGGVPMLVGALRHGAYLIGLGDDESWGNAVMVRGDSPIAKEKGKSKKCPEALGSPATIKGKTVLTTTVSSAHFTLSSWLACFDMKDSDVVIKNMDQPQATTAYDSGVGDIVSLWTPFIFTGQKKGWKIAATTHDAQAMVPLVLVADKTFADKNPELVAKYVKVFMKGIDFVKKEGAAKLAPEYKTFMKEWGGLDMSLEECKLDIENHVVYTLAEQIKMFDSSKGPSYMQQKMQALADFFVAQGKFKKEEMDKVMKSGFITDKFLKMAAGK